MPEAVEVRLELYRGGSCRHPHGMVVRGASWRPRTFPSLFAAIFHPTRGLTLFDTGYSPRFLESTRPFPARLYRWLTPVTLRQGESAAEQLATRGISPSRVSRIVLSHLHADHIAGVRDFPQAELICTRAAYESVRGRGRVGTLLRAFLPGLLPDDFGRSATLLDTSEFTDPSVGSCEACHDLFGDGSILLVPLPGHAAGQVGLLLRVSGGQRCFLVADAAWTRQSLREDLGPHPVAHALFDDAPAATRTLRALHELWRSAPQIVLVPSHCSESSEWDTPSTFPT
jgi:glyoxylase-like metal-dependent hydrolase (beta-lactamase superfamily II)